MSLVKHQMCLRKLSTYQRLLSKERTEDSLTSFEKESAFFLQGIPFFLGVNWLPTNELNTRKL